MQTWQATTSPEHMYRYTLRSTRVLLSWLIVYPITFVAFIVLNYLLPPHAFRLDIGAAIGMALGACLCLAIAAATITLVITPEGVLYRRGFRTTWAVWSDIESVRPWSHSYYGWIGGEGLVIRAEALPPGLARRRTFWRYFIPLEQFAPRWRESQLGDDIRRYAPWLLNGGPGQIN